MIANTECGRIRKETVMFCITVLCLHPPRPKQREDSVGAVCKPTEVQTGHLLNKIPERYYYIKLPN